VVYEKSAKGTNIPEPSFEKTGFNMWPETTSRSDNFQKK